MPWAASRLENRPLSRRMHREKCRPLLRLASGAPVFANGAVTAAMAYAFNQMQNPQPISRGNNAVLTDDEIANIVFNESVSLSGADIDQVRANIAHIIINGDEELGTRRQSIAGTASKTINRQLSNLELSVLGDIRSIVADVRLDRLNGIDPTNGTKFFNFRDLNQFTQTGFQGLSTNPNRFGQTPITNGVLGPLNNSFPTSTLGRTDIYFVPFSP